MTVISPLTHLSDCAKISKPLLSPNPYQDVGMPQCKDPHTYDEED